MLRALPWVVGLGTLGPACVLMPPARAALPTPPPACKLTTSAFTTALTGMPVNRRIGTRTRCSYVAESGTYLNSVPGADLDLVGVVYPSVAVAQNSQAGWWRSYAVGGWHRKRLRSLGADDAIAAYHTVAGTLAGKHQVIAFGDVRFRVGRILVALTVRTSTPAEPGFTFAQLAASYSTLIKHWRSPPPGD
jgi:hypothetical protein